MLWFGGKDRHTMVGELVISHLGPTTITADLFLRPAASFD